MLKGRAHDRAAVWVFVTLLAGAGAVRAQRVDDPQTISGSAGEVIRAETRSGAIVSIRGPMEIAFQGRSASVRLSSGVTATARTRDVRLFLRDSVTVAEARVASIVLAAGAEVALDRVDRGRGRATLRSSVVDLMPVQLTTRQLQLDPLPRQPVGQPGDGCRVGYFEPFPRQARVRRAVVPREEPGGARLRVTIPAGSVVWEAERRGTSSLVTLVEPEVTLLGWVPDGALEHDNLGPNVAAATERSEAACTPRGSTRRVVGQAPLTDVSGALTWATLAVGTELEVVADPYGARLMVVTIEGVRRIAQCDRPLGWIERSALAETTPSLSLAPPLDQE
ncbi:MAG: hypothetical protein U0353_09975 [Sandaracinus sp.]